MKPFRTALIVGAFALLGQGKDQAISEHPLAVNVKQLHPDAVLFAARQVMEACRAEGLHTVNGVCGGLP